MRVPTTADLHAEADAAAQRSEFRSALALSAEILDSAPHDHRARLKLGLCLAALGHTQDGASAMLVVARGLGRRGFHLAAIGACRDAIRLEPGHPGIPEVLEALHAGFGGREGNARPRVPPPLAPAPVQRTGPSRLHPDAPDLVERARALALADPDAGGGPTTEDPGPLPFFSELGRHAFLELLPRVQFWKRAAGEPVVRQGEPGHSLFVVVSGQVEVSRQDEHGGAGILARLGPGSLFGEMSLLTQKPRAASIHTLRPTEMFEIDRAAVEAVAAEQPSIVQDLVRFARRRMIANLIATSPVFRTLGDLQRMEVVRAFETRVAKPGEVLIEEGCPPVGLFLVLEGEVQVSTAESSGEPLVLAHLREGEVIGEIALIEDSLTTATVAALERSVLLHLPKARFKALVHAHPELEAYLRRLATERLVEAEEAAAESQALDADELVLI